MEKILIPVSALVLFLAVSVSGICDEAAGSNIQQCLMASQSNMPSNEDSLNAFCSDRQNVYTCIDDQFNECADDPKQQKLIALFVNIDGFKNFMDGICNNKENYTRITATCHLESTDQQNLQDALNCQQDATGQLGQGGQSSDIKTNLDGFCVFYDKLMGCYSTHIGKTEQCKGMGSYLTNFIGAFRFPYCSYNDAERTIKIREYQYGTAGSTSLYSYTMLTLVSVLAFSAL